MYLWLLGAISMTGYMTFPPGSCQYSEWHTWNQQAVYFWRAVIAVDVPRLLLLFLLAHQFIRVRKMLPVILSSSCMICVRVFRRDCCSDRLIKVLLIGNTTWLASNRFGSLGEAAGEHKIIIVVTNILWFGLIFPLCKSHHLSSFHLVSSLAIILSDILSDLMESLLCLAFLTSRRRRVSVCSFTYKWQQSPRCGGPTHLSLYGDSLSMCLLMCVPPQY